MSPTSLNLSHNVTYADEVIYTEYERFLESQTLFLVNFYKQAGLPLLIMGIFGHLISLVTLFKSSEMQTPSFLYHKALTLAELTYCVNCVIQDLVNVVAKVKHTSDTYNTFFAALYSASFSRIVSSVTGYLILYMTLMIATDRLFAINFKVKYMSMNKRRFGFGAILITLLVSILLNSWASPIEYSYKLVGKSEANHSGPLYHQYALKVRNEPKLYVKLRKIKNIYNSVIRISYPIALVLITLAVVGGFLVQRRKRQRLLNNVNANNRVLRRNQNLFYLLILICLLAIIQVAPTETRRILELLYPMAECRKAMDDQVKMPLAERLKLMAIYMYGHVWTKILSNLCTFLSRSLSFYVYFCFNTSFRAAVLKLVLCRKFRRSSSGRCSTRSSIVLTTTQTH